MYSDPLAPERDRGDRFWGTFLIVLLLHTAVIGVGIYVSRVLFPLRPPEQITWLNGGAIQPSQAPEPTQPETKEAPPQPIEPPPQEPKTPGDIVEPTPTPAPTPAPTPTPKPTTPKPTTPKPKATPTPIKPPIKTTPRPVVRKPTEPQPTPRDGAAPQAGTKPGPGAANGTGTSAVIAEQTKRYFDLIHGDFEALWKQPLTAEDANAGAQRGVIRFRVAADGAVLWARLARSSGSRIVDDSLEAVCRQLTRLPPPSPAIQIGGCFEGSIEMVLNR